MPFQWNGWANVINRINTIYNQQDMVCRSCILVVLILSSGSLAYGLKEYLRDSKGDQGITSYWMSRCPSIWPIVHNYLITCFPKIPEKENCTVLSPSYNVREAKELYVDIQTETRECKHVRNISCTGKFHLSDKWKKL